MNLEGRPISLADTKQQVPVNEEYGCLVRILINAADHFSFPLEARFVSPNDVCKLPRPFILHGITSHEKKLGHFLVVIDFDFYKRNFAVIDPVRDTVSWHPESSILFAYSGYVLIPVHSSAIFWNRLTGIVLLLFGSVLFFKICFRKKIEKKKCLST